MVDNNTSAVDLNLVAALKEIDEAYNETLETLEDLQAKKLALIQAYKNKADATRLEAVRQHFI